MNYTRIFFVFICLIALPSATIAGKPDWVTKRPVDNNYYIGIGYVQKKGDYTDYRQQAKQAALSDLASEITINISSDLVDVAVEQSGLSSEQIRQEIRTRTEADLEGYELVENYEDRNEYWVYYRLSKAVYAANQRRKLENAMNLGSNLYLKGVDQQKNGDITGALTFYLDSFKPIQDYFADPLETTLQGKHVFLRNEMYGATQNLLSHLTLKCIPEKISGKFGQPLSQPLEVRALYRDSTGGNIPVANLPLHFTFLRGNGELIDRLRTNSQGIAQCRVAKVTGHEPLQMIGVSMNLADLVHLDSTNAVVRGMIEGFATPSQRFILEMQGLTAFVESSELNFGQPLDVPQLEPAIKQTLAQRGLSFVDDITKADLMIKLEATSRKGATIYGQFVAYVDCAVSVMDMNTGKEIYKSQLSGIKGIQLDYNHAGLMAYKHTGEKLNSDIVPAILSKIE